MKQKVLAIIISLAMLFAVNLTAFAESGPGGSPPGGSSSSSVSWNGATMITSATTTSNKTYSSTTASQNAVLINTSDNVTLTSPTVTKSGGTSAGDSESFYGINSAVMCKGGGTTTITGANITTNAAGANGVFSYGGNASTNATSGDGTTVVISDSTITTTGNGSGGIMTTGQGTTKASNLTVNTSGASSAAIRSDRGGGTVTVDGGTYTTSGTGSPAIYATATINVSDAELNSTASQGVVNEGGNTVILNDCIVNASNATINSQDYFKNGIFLYQSMSGDASDGASVFTMTGGEINNTYGHVFHVTNTSAAIKLEGVDITNSDSEGVLLSVCDDAWSGLSNAVTVNAENQTLDGTILVGSDSTAKINLSGTSVWTGTTSGSITSHKNSSTVSSSLGTVNLTLSDTALVVLNADTTVSSISGTGYINYNGHTLTVGSKKYTSGSPGVSTITESSETAENRSNSSSTRTSLSKAYSSGALTVTGIKNYTYNGSSKTQSPVIKYNGTVLTKNTDYTLSYSNNTNAGTATVTITGKGNYKSSIGFKYTIAKAANTLTAKGKTVTLKYSKLKKKKQTIVRKKAITLSKAKGTVTYTKSSGNKKITVNKKTGKITVKKGLKKGTYKVKIKVKAAGNSNYKAKTKTVTVTIKVK